MITLVADKQIVRDIFERGWNRQEFDNMKQYFADDLIFNNDNNVISMNLDKFRKTVAKWKQSFPDLHFEISSIHTNDEVTIAHMMLIGTHKGEWRGISASNREIVVPHRFIFRFENNKIHEIWEYNNFTGVEEYLRGEINELNINMKF